MAVRGAYFIFLIGAVDVDVACIRIAARPPVFPGIKAVQPQDARGDQILGTHGFRGILPNETERTPPLEDHAGRFSGTNAVGDLMQAGRRPE